MRFDMCNQIIVLDFLYHIFHDVKTKKMVKMLEENNINNKRSKKENCKYNRCIF